MGLNVAGEDKDIFLCLAALEQGRKHASIVWRSIVIVLSFARRWLLLPSIMLDVQQLVMSRGGDALTLALNAVAVLFLLELDNIFYAIALGERVRARVETVGRVNLAPREAQSLVVSKIAHCTIVAGSFLVSLTQLHRLTGEVTDAKNKQTGAVVPFSAIFWFMFSPFVANWLAIFVTTLHYGGKPADIAKRIAINTASLIIGIISFMILLSASGSTA